MNCLSEKRVKENFQELMNVYCITEQYFFDLTIMKKIREICDIYTIVCIPSNL